MIYFFLARNIRVARERAYAQTIESRGKGPDWWRPYVEEWERPPRVKPVRWGWSAFMGGPVGSIVARGASCLSARARGGELGSSRGCRDPSQ